MRHLTTLSLLLMFLATGCHTHYRAPGAVGRVVDAAISPPACSERLPAATVVSDRTGSFDLPPDSRTQIRFMYSTMQRRFRVRSRFSAAGYATNEVHGTATSQTFWRAQLGK